MRIHSCTSMHSVLLGSSALRMSSTKQLTSCWLHSGMCAYAFSRRRCILVRKTTTGTSCSFGNRQLKAARSSVSSCGGFTSIAHRTIHSCRSIALLPSASAISKYSSSSLSLAEMPNNVRPSWSSDRKMIPISSVSICMKMCVKKLMSSCVSCSAMAPIFSDFSGSKLSFRIATSVSSRERRRRDDVKRERFRRDAWIEVVRTYMASYHTAS